MKKLYILLFTILISSLSFGQEIVLFEEFSTDGNGSRYTTSVPEFSDGSGDFFKRTDGSDISSAYTITSDEPGGFYFAAMDTDGDGQPKVLTLNVNDIDITGFTNMTFVIALAEDDDASNQDWDADTSFTVEVDYNNAGAFSTILQVEAVGGTNTEPAIDTDFDGIGDGAAITNEWQDFQVALGTGTEIDIRITFTNLDAGDEDIAIDYFGIAEDIDLFPEVNVTSPADFAVFPAGTNSVDITWTTANQQPGDRVDIIVNGNLTSDVTSPFTVDTSAGGDFNCEVRLMNGTDNLDSNGVFFTVLTTSTCFDLSGGAELFEIATVQTNSDGDVWTESGGIYTANGFCGGGCEETVNTWLIFGPLDMTATTDLILAFDAAESFGATTLNINYSTDYTTCPSLATWTSIDAIVDPGNYEVDVFDSTGAITDVFIGIQYEDDGVDGYSGWSLSNMSLRASGNCPTLGFRPTSSCPALSIADNRIESFEMYPNPTSSGSVTLSSKNNAAMKVTVFDMLGKEVVNETVSDNTLDVSGLRSGIYIMKVSQEDARITKKLVIQ